MPTRHNHELNPVQGQARSSTTNLVASPNPQPHPNLQPQPRQPRPRVARPASHAAPGDSHPVVTPTGTILLSL